MALATPLKRVRDRTDDRIAQVIELSAFRAVERSREEPERDPLRFFRALWLAMVVSALMWLVLAVAIFLLLSHALH
ncbi:MAG: hypothetical protein WBB74_03220 [Gaiellaceae bacterium]